MIHKFHCKGDGFELRGELVELGERHRVSKPVGRSGEQDKGATQISRAILQLDQVIQQNASGAEELASTAEQLSAQSDLLQAKIGFFRLANDGAAAVAMQARKTAIPARKEHRPDPMHHMTLKGKSAVTQGAKKGNGKGMNIVLETGKDDLDQEFVAF